MFEIELMISREIHPNLGIKGGAKIFFDFIESLPQSNILINFEGSEFMSRSFAQEYIKQRRSTNKHIEETKVPENIRSMLKLVENSNNPTTRHIIKNL